MKAYEEAFKPKANQFEQPATFGDASIKRPTNRNRNQPDPQSQAKSGFIAGMVGNPT